MTRSHIALITGGSRGLGADMVRQLAAKGLDVILTYRSQKEEALGMVAQVQQLGRKAVALPLDVGDTKSFAASFAETTEEQFDSLCNIHFKGTYFLTQRALRAESKP